MLHVNYGPPSLTLCICLFIAGTNRIGKVPIKARLPQLFWKCMTMNTRTMQYNFLTVVSTYIVVVQGVQKEVIKRACMYVIALNKNIDLTHLTG